MSRLGKLIEADGGSLKRTAGTNGGEYAGACPWCGGFDRFRVWPEQDGGRYWCRGCGKAGDSIQYLKERRGLSFIEACRYLCRNPGPRYGRSSTPAVKWEPREAAAPVEAWQERARTFLDGAIADLWSTCGKSMRAWLKREKGLQDATIKEACLGYSAVDIYESRQAWGLTSVLKDDGTERKQWIPAGLVIPHIVNGAVHRLRVRRENPGDGPRYVVVSGSSTAPMMMHVDQAEVVIVESELDGLLLAQEVGDLAGIVALGSAQAKPDSFTHEVLKTAVVILVSLDTDDTGAKAAWAFWPTTYGCRVKRWPSVKGKDPSDARLNGLNLRTWVVAGIFGTEAAYERFCIQTVEGGLTDIEALQMK